MSFWSKFDKLRDRIDTVPGIECALGFAFDKVISPTRAWADGKELILAGTNNYLGLSFSQSVLNACSSAVHEYGTGTTGSRLANGTLRCHELLEQELASFFNRRRAIIFSTGYQANVGVLSGLTGPGDMVFADSECHASIFDGCRLSGARISRFAHNRPEDLKRKLSESSANNKLIVVEGVYSMSGDRAPLSEIVRIKAQRGAMLMVDEAHSFGVLGKRGRGVAEEYDVEEHVDLTVGTFSKSLGAVGGFAVSDAENFNFLRLAARSYIFSASLPASVIQGVRAALQHVRDGNDLREQFHKNVRLLTEGLCLVGITPVNVDSPIIALKIGEIELAFELWKNLLRRNVYVNLIAPPASPDNAAMLRIGISAAHSENEIREICRAVAGALRDCLQCRRGAQLETTTVPCEPEQ